MNELPFTFDKSALQEFCRRRGIRRLSVFGSALRKDFRAGKSDIDVFAEFLPGALRGVGLDFFGYADELSEIFGAKVDFCVNLNKYIAPRVMSEHFALYERA
jgi:uncharacterized protein